MTRTRFACILGLVAETCLGIDIGGTTVKAAAIADREVLWTNRSERYARPTAEQLSAAVAQACSSLTGNVCRVGLCVPGLLDDSKQRVTAAANVPGLVGISLPELIERAMNRPGIVPVVVNDANATAYDIYSVRKPTGRLLVLAIGTGVGASVLDDGTPLFVDGESPGHLGQMDVAVEGKQVTGPDGGRGGLEGYLGTAALRARYGSNPASKMRPGDPPFRALVRAIRVCHAIYRPHHICLAGGTGIRLARLLEPLKRTINTNLTSIARPGWTLSFAESDFHAAVGAARIASRGSWPVPRSS